MRLAVAAAVLVVFAACAGGDDEPVMTEGSGPPRVRAEVVSRHAAQLDEELGDRPAGSQEEQIASQYILGHLQRAGYLVRLDAVPVGNLIDSSNLVALPPSRNDPKAVVVAGYDTPEGDPGGGERAGLLLELARAFNVVAPDHDVEFAAVGADAGGDQDESRGSRRLVRVLTEEDLEPEVIVIAEVESGAPVHAIGPLAETISPDAVPEVVEEGNLFERAGLPWASVSGDPGELGARLIDYLEQVGG